MSLRAPGATSVVSVPANHPYVATSIAAPGRLDEELYVWPDVIPPNRPPGQWWPPVALDPEVLGGWLHHDVLPRGADQPAVDLMHVHFGFEGVSLDDLDACLALLDRHDVPLVLTVHDLRNPHLEHDDDYAPRLDRLVRAADKLLTLTDAAAEQVRTRWGRECVVIPHPHVAPLERIARVAAPRPQHGGLRVGLPLKSLRANTLTAPQVEQVAAAVTGAGAELAIGIHAEAMHPRFIRHDPTMTNLLRRLDAHPRITVTEHDRFDDDAYLDDLATYDVVVLPYRFGTHSGVLEACRDVATLVIAPQVGCYGAQAPCPTYDPTNIDGTLPTALTQTGRFLDPTSAPNNHGDGWFVDRAGRAEQARNVRRAHREVYAAVLRSARQPTSNSTAEGTDA